MPGDQRLRRDAMAALDTMLTGDHDATDRALHQLVTRHGPTGVPIALMHWCDAALARIPAEEGPVKLLWKNTTTGHVHTSPDDVPVTEQWAGRLLAARANGDRDMFIALVEAVPAAAVPAHVGAVVQMAAHIIQEAG